MNDPPNRATVRDYASRWGIEPMFSDFKSRGFRLEDPQLRAPDRLDRLLVHHGLGHVLVRARRPGGGPPSPNAVGKKTQEQTDPHHWSFRKLARGAVSWFTRGLRAIRRKLQTQQPLPPFYRLCPVRRN
jgi:hypothetical protein